MFLSPDNTPKPVDAGIENSGLLQGIPQQAFPEQNHEAHVEAHKSLFLTQAVMMNPQLQSVIIAHVMQHLQFMATQMAEQQLPPEVQQERSIPKAGGSGRQRPLENLYFYIFFSIIFRFGGISL